ncbi:MAG: hypothetical protein ACJAUN_000048 [Alcanivorax sp.]|jgi:hypothetical protein
MLCLNKLRFLPEYAVRSGYETGVSWQGDRAGCQMSDTGWQRKQQGRLMQGARPAKTGKARCVGKASLR